MSQEVIFMPLGGGQRVGASCYYLRLGDANLLLDAGLGLENGVVFEPSFHTLLTLPFFQSLNQLNQIFISHAHTDHVGYLLRLMKYSNRATVYMTEMTAILSEYQLYDKNYITGGKKKKIEQERLAAQHLFNKVIKVSYMQKLDFGNYKVTFLPAGHIPGAMMMLFEYGKRKILYTGDYSIAGTPLTAGCLIPENIEIDTVILCGLHAKHPKYFKKTDRLYQTIRSIYDIVKRKQRSVICYVPQLSKGIEFVKILNERNTKHIPIYLDDSLIAMVRKMEQMSIPILNEDIHFMSGQFPSEPHIYITAQMGNTEWNFYEKIKVDFSLHEDFLEMKTFIKKINPKQAVIVHCSKEMISENTIEQIMMLDGECRTQFIFAEEEEIYQL